METLREMLQSMKAEGRAAAHFNVSDSNQLRAIAEAARETSLPVVVGLSEGEREFFPIQHMRALVDIYREQGVKMYLNADHTYSVEKVKRALSAGVDSVVVDGAKLSVEENTHLAAMCVKYARASGRDVLVEGELGYIGSSSKVMDALPEGAAATEALMPKPEDVAAFVKATGVDLMAPAVGNIHGVIKGGNPKLSIARIQEDAEAAGVPLVLHGGSGVSDAQFREAIRAGIAMVHINTELRVTYRDALAKELAGEPDETTPYKFLAPAVEEMKRYAIQKMKLFAQ